MALLNWGITFREDMKMRSFVRRKSIYQAAHGDTVQCPRVTMKTERATFPSSSGHCLLPVFTLVQLH